MLPVQSAVWMGGGGGGRGGGEEEKADHIERE